MESEACLMCLDFKTEVLDIIGVNSDQWKTENIDQLIEKHLWLMKTSCTSNWICISCWQELNRFHKFYERIKTAHNLLDSQHIIEDVSESFEINNFENSNECKKEIFECSAETEFLLEQPLSPERIIESENLLIKLEKDDLDDIPLNQRGNKRRPSKDIVSSFAEACEDPLKKTKRIRSLEGNKTSKDISTNFESSFMIENDENALVKSEIEDEKGATSLSDLNEISDSDSEYEENEEKNNSVKTNKKKRKNPDEETCNEYDKIIAEHFQIFCSLCQIPIENYLLLRKHFRELHNQRCFIMCCKKKIFTRPKLVDHINFHLDPNYFKCKQCGKVYSERYRLDIHMKLHDNGQREHICDVCGKSFASPGRLENHKIIHAPDYEKFSCNSCDKFFTTQYGLNHHIQAIHHNKLVRVCDICGKTMRCLNSFKLHMERHDEKLAAPIKCDICGISLIDRRGLRRHKNNQHPVGGQKEHPCPICSKISPNIRALRSHIRFAHESHHKYKCTLCDKAFKRPEAVKEHMATHTGTPLYTCPWCPKTFIWNGNMHSHRKKAHPKEWEEAKREKYGRKTDTVVESKVTAISKQDI